MFFKRFGKFQGGINLPADKHATIDIEITPVENLTSLLVPLDITSQIAAELTVTAGQLVSQNQLIARDCSQNFDLFSPATGIVGNVTECSIIEDRSFKKVRAIEILEIDKNENLFNLSDCTSPKVLDWENSPSNDLREILEKSSLLTVARKPMHIKNWLAKASPKSVNKLICNAVCDHPYGTATHRLLAEFGKEILAGLAILAKAADIKNVTVAVCSSLVDRYENLESDVAGINIQRIALPRKYPIGARKILLKVLTGKEIKISAEPESIGATIVTPETCLAAYCLVACGKYIPGRVVTQAGKNFPTIGNFFIPTGAKISELYRYSRKNLIVNSPMTGTLACEDAVITPAIEMLVATDLTQYSAPTQCIRCGWCRTHCPTRLNVSMLNDCYELCKLEQAKKMGVQSCIGCGICSYICPASLPLSFRMRELKTAVSQVSKSDLSDLANIENDSQAGAK